MDLYINAIAHYIPEARVPNSYFKDVNGLDDEWIFSRTGIKTRSKAGEGENTNTMALEAVARLKDKLPFAIEDTDLVVAATYSPHDTVATAAHAIQRAYTTRAAKCLSVSSACSSFINAIEIVQGYFAMGKATKAIVVASEHNTEYSNESCPQSGHLWGDGAIAIAISTSPEGEKAAKILDIFTRGLGHIGKADTAVYLRPHHGGIGMPEGRDVFINACHYMIEGLQVVTESNGKTLADLKYIAPHQANKRIMATIARQIDFPEDRILSNIGEVGNTGCPSCGIALSQNLDRVERGDLVGLTVFGGGYSCGAVLLEFI
ncbi:MULTISPECIES: 3-oxoacyl-ACP synthase III family protein [Butyricimonas]|uniref:3-oxoacyl-ACP synthase III family protein n=1 Tax=Butyricimonas TaxID=574697 RepID=UPI001D08719A|nr:MULTISPECIES: 3-oxoacyl-[acyl-carrier-protein] synthase III C-terminal domain-containing protein [Butyricimonas]MCB6970763.1 ketoacyl-ACP synthase III [Butyricimonas synergistica]MCG4517477.1 ketoacyl-ACP synthase III [Butyricimonas sp. DFI.6.44]